MSKASTANDLAESLRGLMRKLKRRMREQSRAGDLSWSQFTMLSRLERDGPATVTTLAHAEGVRPQSMGATMAALETAGHVRAEPDPQDGRKTLWSVTSHCRDLIHATRTAGHDWLQHASQKTLTPQEQKQLTEALVSLERIAES
jgi:DNA-binding MarR family transcriptional regulator